MIAIKNDIFSSNEANFVYEALAQSSKWSFSGKSNDASEPTFWYHDLAQSSELTDIFINSIKKLRFGIKTVNAFYANGQSHGQCGQFHTDSKSANDITFLYYANKFWEPEWGGYTIFKDQDGNVSNLIIPEFNKCVIFNSNIVHAGMEPTRLFAGLRITVAFKFSIEA